MKPVIAMIGTFDSKGAEYAYLREAILAQGGEVLAVNAGILGSTDRFPVAVEADAVIAAAGEDLGALRTDRDRGKAMAAAARGLATLLPRLVREHRLDGAIGMGGTGGTSVLTAGLRALSVGFPKVC